jgi:hypothetical protein
LPVRADEGRIRIVDVRRFGGRTVEFDDREVLATHEGSNVPIPDIETADEEAGIAASDLIDPVFERARQ